MRLLCLFVCVFGGLLLTSCAHRPPPDPQGVEPMGTSAYHKLLRKHTRSTNQYSGFYQTFQADVTMMTSELQNGVLRQKGYYLQWDQKTYLAQREKALQEASAYAKFFMRFYTPNRDHDDLNQSKSIWKIFLQHGSSRFEGKINKINDKLVEIQTIYPNMDRFSSAYEITFNVPMNTIEQSSAKVILTSSLGHAEFDFPAQK